MGNINNGLIHHFSSRKNNTMKEDMAYITVLVLALVLQFQGSSSNHCLENPPHLNKNSGNGTVTEIGGLKTYVSGSPNTSKEAIILISDIFGYEAPKLRLIGDKVADAGYYTLVPDFFFGDPAIANDSSFNYTAWFQRHSPEKGFKDGTNLISALIKKGFSSIGVAGFCWGGGVAIKLASSVQIKAVVAIHPSGTTIDDIKKIKIPIAFLGSEIDEYAPPKLLQEFARILAEKKQANFVKIYPGTRHGFAIRYDENNATAVKIAEEARNDMQNWFIKYRQ